MRILKTLLCTFLMLCLGLDAVAQQVKYQVSGRVVNAETGKPIEFATLLLSESSLWAVTDQQGFFVIKNVPAGKNTLTVQCLGYQKHTWPLTVKRNVPNLTFKLMEENLKLSEVTVMARRKNDEATTSYTIDRTALDNQQLLNLSDAASLLPGGKTVNPSLMNDNRLALRSGSSEKGNMSFGTAIEVDGVRMDNNTAVGETMAASTRTLSSSNIESVEIVTGIPSVEYGDLSNGIVKVNTRRGKSPFIIEGKLNQHTRQIALNKGFDLGNNNGVLNVALEHARSFSDAASPYTAYQRNNLSVDYSNIFFRDQMPLTLSLGVTKNVGGYRSEADPDEFRDDYTKVRDNALRAHFDVQWLLNKAWITNLSLKGSVSFRDQLSESYYSTSSASTQPYIHTLEKGYFVAQDYDVQPDANIILGPTGYWYVKQFSDTEPLTWSLRLKADQTHRFGKVMNRLMAGAELTGSKNQGRGTYYDDMRYAPSWREYRYDELPTMRNLAFYLEDKLMVPTTRRATAELTAGLRDDVTMIKGSDYGTVSSLSPRVNARYVFWRAQRQRWVSDLNVHAGWGKSVKLPSYQVLFPSPSYSDLLAFASTSTADNKSYYAYFTFPQKALYSPDLKWQYTNQTDIGVELNVKGTRISLSAFHHRTFHPYMATRFYTPFMFHYTGQNAVQNCGIPVENRRFAIDQNTGVVTVSDVTNTLSSVELPYSNRQTYEVGQQYANGSPVSRYGVEWIVDFAKIRVLSTSVRLDGNYYYYKGTDDVLFADIPLGVSNVMSGGQLYQYVGYYRGSNVTGTGYSANASVSNGSMTKQLNLNATVTTHLPKIRMIVSLRVESSLYRYQRQLSEFDDGTRGYMLEGNSGYVGTPYDGSSTDKYVVVYPEYYSTWENPAERIPFYERFLWAKENDQTLYSDLSKLVVRSNYAYTMNPNRLSAYYSANLSVTKEIGDHVSVSFYANNFFNHMGTVHSTQTNLETSLFDSSYIPSYYYGLSLKLKL